MRNAQYVYALAGFTVERRENGWFFCLSANRHKASDFKGPYSSEASVALMIARELRKEIVRRHARQTMTDGAAA